MPSYIIQTKMKKLVIMHADDFGLSTGTNLGILRAYKEGLLTSTSLMTTTPGFNMAVKLIRKCPNLGVGVHLSLTSGKSVLKPKLVNKLVHDGGEFYPSFTRVLFKSQTDRDYLFQVREELNAQFNKAKKAGINLDHINSERHVHMIPKIYPLVLEIAKKNKIKYLRVPKEDFHLAPNLSFFISPFIDTNIVKFILLRLFSINKKVDKIKFFGVIYTTKMNTKILKHTISLIKPGLTEVLLHPAQFKITPREKLALNYESQKMIHFMKDKNRQAELKALTNKSVMKLIQENNIILTNFKNLT